VSGEGQGAPQGADKAWQVLDLLADSFEGEGGHISGQELAGKLGIGKPELLRCLDRLRGLGYAFQALPGAGYKLVHVPDSIEARVLEPLLEPLGVGAPIHSATELPSTNDEAHRLAAEGAPHGALVLADTQTKGRGRRGRSWVTPPGTALAMTLVLRPQLPPARAPELQLVAAVAVCEAARALGAKSAGIKWPNDVEAGGRKLCGLLAELRGSAETLEHVVLGIGINVNVRSEHLDDELRAIATSLHLERGEPVSRAWALYRLLERLDHWLGLHESEGFEPVRERWRELSSTLHRRVRIEAGAVPLLGEAVDLAEDGALLVRDDAGKLHAVNAGDVIHLRPVAG
jgi:BirA family transcriptional regulator, biotin operon repressor / biotin---[acetyl-CoA-carboxylase] ligase